ncbi:hypothetical protein DSO57_1017886 [Entomophthora muscae]|uniref:Uncharacterized protein n=1 Tax=Entomophthora muscae TaxID=34485 RepID=A0ACC2UDY0_9FUNG|nr:hypothetical protein DSO57_1017886 [Entomophthora muscae]
MSDSFRDGFNTGPNKRLSTSANRSMFGASATGPSPALGAASSAATTTSSGFSFGATSTASGTSASGFSFGATSTASGTSASGAGFGASSTPAFGTSAATSATAAGIGATKSTTAFGTPASAPAFGIGASTSQPAFGFGAATPTAATASTGNTLGSSTTAFGTGSAFGATTSAFGGSTSFLGGSSFKPTNSFSLGTSIGNSNAQANTCFPNLSVSASPTDLKYSELLHKAFCLTQEYNITPNTLVRDLPQEAQSIFAQIENFRSKEKEAKEALKKKTSLLAPALGRPSDNAVDAPLPIDDKLTILLRDLKSLKTKLQRDAATTKALNAMLEIKFSQAKKAQLKLQSIKAKKEPLEKNSCLNPLGNVPFSQLITPFSQSSFSALKSSLTDSGADVAYDETEYFIQLLKDIQEQGEALKAEISKIHNTTYSTDCDPTPQILMDQLMDKIYTLSHQEMSIRTRLCSVIKEHNIGYSLDPKKSEPKDDIGLGNLLFDRSYVPQPKQDDVLFEIATTEIKPVDLSKLKPK